MQLVPVPLTEEEVDRYYEGMSNASLWPLYHDVVEKPEYHRTWWDTYVQVNKRFAERAAEVAARGRDRLGARLPAAARAGPAAPAAARPDHRLLPAHPVPAVRAVHPAARGARRSSRACSGADLVGFQRPNAAANFVQLARRLHELPARGQRHRVRRAHRGGPGVPDLDRRRGLRPAGRLARGAGPRRGDPQGAGQPGEDHPRASTGWTTPRASASGCRPSRSCWRTARSRPRTPCWCRWPRPAASGSSTTCTCARQIEQQVGHINGVFGSIAGPAVHYFNQSMPREELAALYRAADVMLVTPYRDGMNLVAKEYVAARGDLGGALVLSEFAGAAAELKQAFLVNPHDIAGVKTSWCGRCGWSRPRAPSGCGRCAGTCSRTTWTTGRRRSSRRCRRAGDGARADGRPGREPAPRRAGARRSPTLAAPAPAAGRQRLRRRAGPARRRSVGGRAGARGAGGAGPAGGRRRGHGRAGERPRRRRPAGGRAG